MNRYPIGAIDGFRGGGGDGVRIEKSPLFLKNSLDPPLLRQGRPSLLAIKQVTAAPQKKTEKNSADSGFAER